MPPPNDNEQNAIILDSEFGQLDDQTTVGSTGQVYPAKGYPFPGNALDDVGDPGNILQEGRITNGHDVWYRWRVAWMLNVGYYLIETVGTTFKHVIRAYAYAPSPEPGLPPIFKILSSRGGFTPGFGTDQRLQLIISPQVGAKYVAFGNGSTGQDLNYPPQIEYVFPDPSFFRLDGFIIIQVDAADKLDAGRTGKFSLRWGRSTIPSIYRARKPTAAVVDGDPDIPYSNEPVTLDELTAFQNPNGRRAVLKGKRSLDLSDQVIWFGTFPAGKYRIQYIGGAYNQLQAPEEGSGAGTGGALVYGSIETAFGTQAFPIFDDGKSIGTPIGNYNALTRTEQQNPGVIISDPRFAKGESRFDQFTFEHLGRSDTDPTSGKIGVKYQDPNGPHLGFNGSAWQGAIALPPWQHGTWVVLDLGNINLDPPASFALFRMFPVPDFQAYSVVGSFDLLPPDNINQARFFIANNTKESYPGMKFYTKDNTGTPTEIRPTDFAPGEIKEFPFTYPGDVIPAKVSIFFKFRDADLTEFGPIIFDLTPKIEVSAVFNGIVVGAGAVRKWSVTFTIRNSQPPGYGYQPKGFLGSGAGAVEYPHGQDLGSEYQTTLLAYFVPTTAGASDIAVKVHVVDTGWTSQDVDAAIHGVPL